VLAMLDTQTHLRPRSAVGTQLIRDHDAWRGDGGFQELSHEPLRCAAVSPTLDQDVENETVLINDASKPVLLASNRDDDFIQTPFVAASRRPPADLIGEYLAGARFRKSRKYREPQALPRPFGGSTETGNRATRRR